MKIFLSILILIFGFACNEPMQVTADPDDHTATSGTLGSQKAENQLPKETRDTTMRADTITHKKR